MSGALNLQQVPVFNDIRPVMSAGVVDEYHHLAKAGYCIQRFQRLFGQGAYAKDNHAARQVGGSFCQALCGCQELAMQIGSAVSALILGNALLNSSP